MSRMRLRICGRLLFKTNFFDPVTPAFAGCHLPKMMNLNFFLPSRPLPKHLGIINHEMQTTVNLIYLKCIRDMQSEMQQGHSEMQNAFRIFRIIILNCRISCRGSSETRSLSFDAAKLI